MLNCKSNPPRKTDAELSAFSSSKKTVDRRKSSNVLPDFTGAVFARNRFASLNAGIESNGMDSDERTKGLWYVFDAIEHLNLKLNLKV